jgi:hypothetical protein
MKNWFKRQAKNIQQKLESLVPITFKNKLLKEHAQKLGMQGTLLQARKNVINERNKDYLAVRSAPTRATNQRSIAFAAYINNMSLKKVLLKLLDLNCSSDLFNKSLVDNVKILEMYNIKQITRDLVESSKKFGITVTSQMIENNIKNQEKIELVQENVDTAIDDLIVAMKSMSVFSNDVVKHYSSREGTVVMYNGSIRFSGDVEREDAKIVNDLSDKILQESINLLRPRVSPAQQSRATPRPAPVERPRLGGSTNTNSNAQAPNTNPNTQPPNVNPNTQAPGANPNVQPPNANPGAQAHNANPNVQPLNANANAQALNANPNVQPLNANANAQALNANPNIAPPNPFNQGAQAHNIQNQADFQFIDLLNNPNDQGMEEEGAEEGAGEEH